MKTLLRLWSAWGDGKLVDATFALGLLLLAYGLEHVDPGIGLAVAGALLVLYIRPLGRWIR